MNAVELIKRLNDYGADTLGINDRFRGDTQLYEECLRLFFVEKSFEALENSIVSQQYDRAFEAAHTLKGVTGNLGLTPLYESLCVLVESLRAKKYYSVKVEYENVLTLMDTLKNFFFPSL